MHDLKIKPAATLPQSKGLRTTECRPQAHGDHLLNVIKEKRFKATASHSCHSVAHDLFNVVRGINEQYGGLETDINDTKQRW